MKKRIATFLSIILMSAVIFSGCTQGSKEESSNKKELEGSVIALGSSAMQPLVEEAAKSFMEKNEKIQIQVQGGGSGTGLSQVSQGACDIGNSDVFSQEKEGIDSKLLKDNKICVVGMATVVNKNVGVENLNKNQLIKIFSGEIKNWNEVGGKNQKIVLVNRPSTSGTRATFVKFGLDGNKEAEGITEDSSGTVKKIISETPGSIGYLAFSYIDDSITKLKLDSIEANEENIINGKYPIWAYQHAYTKVETNEITQKFIEYLTRSKEVQEEIVPALGYIPIGKMKIERDEKGKIITI